MLRGGTVRGYGGTVRGVRGTVRGVRWYGTRYDTGCTAVRYEEYGGTVRGVRWHGAMGAVVQSTTGTVLRHRVSAERKQWLYA